MALTGLTQLPPEVRTYFDRLLLALARPYFIYDLFAQKRQIPLNSGDQLVFRRYGTLDVGVGKSVVIDLELLKAALGQQGGRDYKSRRERLNPRTSKRGCDSLNSLVTMRGNAEELPRPIGTGSKVTARTAASVPLTDGQTPPGDQLSVTDFKAQIQWYGKQQENELLIAA